MSYKKFQHKKSSKRRHTHDFANIPSANIERSSFDRSHSHKTTFNIGQLVPVYVDEALPGDTFNLRMTAFSRLATPIFPIMDNIYMDTHFFSVPNRLVWENWVKFNGEQKRPTDTTDFVIPSIIPEGGTGFANGGLADYFGMPTGKIYNPSALFHRAYRLIWNEWYRDENLQDSVEVSVTDGPDTVAIPLGYDQLLYRNKQKDYFTGCLPWPQKGDSPPIGLTGYAPVEFIPGVPGAGKTGGFVYGDGTEITSVHTVQTDDSGQLKFENENKWGAYNPKDTMKADLSVATGVTINALREAFQIQRLLERDARGGTRYTEIIKSHFGVTSPDARLQRPEYLGGSSHMVNISPIAQTSNTTDTSAQGNLAATGTVTIHNAGFTKSFTEHSIVIGIVSVRLDLTYQQGLNRMFSRKTRYDFYWPALSHLGEQTVLRKEIHLEGSPSTDQDNEVFGYQERYAEYRYKPSIITGKFRTIAPGSLDAWHLSEYWPDAGTPTLSNDFISCEAGVAPLNRVIAIPGETQFIFDSHIKLKCARPMPVYSVPGMVDHF